MILTLIHIYSNYIYVCVRVHVLCTGKSCAVWRAWHLTLKRRTWGTCGSLLVWRCALVSLRAWRSAACLRERRWGTPFHSFQQMNFINHIKDCQTSDRWRSLEIIKRKLCSTKLWLISSHSWQKVQRQMGPLSMTWSSLCLISKMLGPEETWWHISKWARPTIRGKKWAKSFKHL